MARRYTFSNLKNAASNPRLVFREAGRLVAPIRKQIFRATHGDGTDVIHQDWDNLFLLDACRYDAFRQHNTIPGRLEKIVSKGSRSWGFMQENFVGRDLHDTVYVSANPYTENLADDVFYTVEPVYLKWDGELGTVQPEKVVEAALQAHREYPDKKLIVHFMQPHDPYIGPIGDMLRGELGLRGWDKYKAHEDQSAEQTGVSIWKAAMDGHVSHGELRAAYGENLSIALDHVAELLETIGGKSVISADHGEMLGERPCLSRAPRYGHPQGLCTPELRVVPWLVIDSDKRRGVVSEEPLGFNRLVEDAVNERLRALGYKV